MNYTQADYERERAICDKANAYIDKFRGKNGWVSIPTGMQHPPYYSACDNAMRGRVEQFEILRDLPAKFSAYLSSDGKHITCWPGNVLGSAWAISSRPAGGSVYSCRYYYGRANIAGKLYAWQGFGEGMLCHLRAIKGES